MLEEKITDKEIEQVADDEKQQDWNRLEYQDIYKKGFIDGAKWVRTKLTSIIQQEIDDAKPKWNYNMDEAPKDGTRILVINSEDSEVYWVSWDKDEVFHPGCKSKWTWCVPYSHQDEQGGCETVNNPIAWMLVPKPSKRGE